MDLISLLVSILVIGLILWLLLYVVQQLPLPAPFVQVARIVIIVIGIILLLRILMGVAGVPVTL